MDILENSENMMDRTHTKQEVMRRINEKMEIIEIIKKLQNLGHIVSWRKIRHALAVHTRKDPG